MALTTQIQWVNRKLPTGQIVPGHTYNPWWGVQRFLRNASTATHKGSPPATVIRPPGDQQWGPASTSPRRFFGESHWQEPLTWQRQAERDGHRHSVFCASMADVYESNPLLIPHRKRLWELIEATPWLNWLILTKRPENILAMSPWKSQFPDNVWLGTSVGLQRRAEERVPLLLQVPAVVRFLSCEPLLGRVDLSPWIADLQWIICGGESGTNARPMNLTWARLLREQCQSAQVPYFFKQIGGRYHNSGGSQLDGHYYQDMPPEFPNNQERRVSP